MRLLLSLIAAASVSSLLLGCGGGDESSADTQGFWVDEDSVLLVTGSGESWIIRQDGYSLRLAKGNISSSGSSITGNFKSFADGIPDFSVSGTVVEKSLMSGVVSVPGSGTSAYSLRYSTEYDKPATLAQIAGTYIGMSGATGTIDNAGKLYVNDDGCVVSGTVTPDASGKNFYRVSAAYSEQGCSLGALTVEGVMALADADTVVGGIVSGNLGAAFMLTKAD